jgi:hypothetical protein
LAQTQQALPATVGPMVCVRPPLQDVRAFAVSFLQLMSFSETF